MSNNVFSAIRAAIFGTPAAAPSVVDAPVADATPAVEFATADVTAAAGSGSVVYGTRSVAIPSNLIGRPIAEVAQALAPAGTSVPSSAKFSLNGAVVSGTTLVTATDRVGVHTTSARLG